METAKTLYEYWRARAEVLPDKRSFGDDLHWVTSLESLAIAEHIAARLRHDGIQKGDLVALRADRRLLTVSLLIALRAIGAAVALTDPRYEPNTSLAERPLSRPVAAVIEPTGDSTFTVTTDGKTTEFDVFALPPTRLAPTPCKPEDPAFWLFFGDDTAEPTVYSETDLMELLCGASPIGTFSPDDIVLSALPFHTTFGLLLLCGTAVLGYSLFLPKQADAPSLVCAVETARVTRLCGAPVHILAVCENADGHDLSSLRGGCLTEPLCSERNESVVSVLGAVPAAFSA